MDPFAPDATLLRAVAEHTRRTSRYVDAAGRRQSIPTYRDMVARQAADAVTESRAARDLVTSRVVSESCAVHDLDTSPEPPPQQDPSLAAAVAARRRQRRASP